MTYFSLVYKHGKNRENSRVYELTIDYFFCECKIFFVHLRTMRKILFKYLPENAVIPCFELIKVNNIYLRIVNERKTRHGDYRQLPNGQHLITMNATANKYRFLITFEHS
mgnify:CR=1 FL=1